MQVGYRLWQSRHARSGAGCISTGVGRFFGSQHHNCIYNKLAINSPLPDLPAPP